MNEPIAVTTLSANRFFHLGTAALLLLTAIAKLGGLFIDGAEQVHLDPVFQVNSSIVYLAVAVVELIVGAVLVVCHGSRLKNALILWLALVFILYRVGHWWSASARPCPCGGALNSFGWISADALSRFALSFMLVGALVFLAGPFIRAIWQKLGMNWKRRCRAACMVAACLALVPPVQVLALAFFDPPTTGPILLRSLGGLLRRCQPTTARFEYMPRDQISPHFYRAVLAAEDNAFYKHRGFNWQQIRIAIQEAVATGKPIRGGSTITQQSARSLFLWQGRSWIRKTLETYYALWMEMLLSKERILDLYVNCVEMGEGIYGVEAGANEHFGIGASKLDQEQAALLAAILPAPKRWNPRQPSEGLTRRQQLILRRTEELWAIDAGSQPLRSNVPIRK